MDIFIIGIFVLYSIEHLIISLGLLKSFKPAAIRFNAPNDFPSVSLIVSAKNEEKNIGSCIESLLKLNYPEKKLEIIIINDCSDDTTGDIIRSYSEKFSNIKYFEPEGKIAHLRGKANALAQAIKKSSGEIIFTTDADCIVKPSWIKELIQYYDSKTGVVCGFSIPKTKFLFWGIQSFDWLYLLSLSSGSAGLNDQLSCVGNNMSFRRSAYEDVGGYENIKFSVTEDFMLLQTIKRKTNWKTKFPVNLNTLNFTLPCLTFKELYRQKKRWGRGGLDINWFGWCFGVIGWLMSVSILLGWIFVGLKFYIVLLLLKFLIDFFLTFPVIFRFKIYYLFLYLIPFEIYFTFYAFSLPFAIILDPVTIWKNQKL